jgi:hypothetical protein
MQPIESETFMTCIKTYFILKMVLLSTNIKLNIHKKLNISKIIYVYPT